MTDPSTFDEKLQWLNQYWQDPLKFRCADKFALRGYAEEHRLGMLLPHLYGVYAKSDEIRLDALPDRFVLKCSHGCKCNVFCYAKKTLDWKTAKRNLDIWMKTDFSMLLGERHYGKVTPRIICEELLSDETGGLLPADYKVFCFAGKPRCTMVATAREPNGIAKLAFYDLEWTRKLPYCLPSLEFSEDIPKPSGYAEMLDYAQTLSEPFPFVRVDFYCINGRPRLGEMTFTPGACVSADYMTDLAQRELGEWITLPSAARIPFGTSEEVDWPQ